MKVSEVTVEDIANRIRLDEQSDIELKELEEMKASAIAEIASYTGLSVEELDKHEDITQALYIMVGDMFDNRNLYIEGKATNVNKAVERILSMHSVNLL